MEKSCLCGCCFFFIIECKLPFSLVLSALEEDIEINKMFIYVLKQYTEYMTRSFQIGIRIDRVKISIYSFTIARALYSYRTYVAETHKVITKLINLMI